MADLIAVISRQGGRKSSVRAMECEFSIFTYKYNVLNDEPGPQGVVGDRDGLEGDAQAGIGAASMNARPHRNRYYRRSRRIKFSFQSFRRHVMNMTSGNLCFISA